MIVCVCNAVSCAEIKREVAAGCPSFEHLQERVGVAVACGSCRDCAVQMFEQAKRPPLVLNFGSKSEERAPAWASLPTPSFAR